MTFWNFWGLVINIITDLSSLLKYSLWGKPATLWVSDCVTWDHHENTVRKLERERERALSDHPTKAVDLWVGKPSDHFSMSAPDHDLKKNEKPRRNTERDMAPVESSLLSPVFFKQLSWGSSHNKTDMNCL